MHYVITPLACELIGNGVAAIFGPSSKTNSGKFRFSLYILPLVKLFLKRIIWFGVIK